MKRLALSISLILCTTTFLMAQDEAAPSGSNSFVSKNGHQVLPERGDFAITVGATNLLRYTGDLFGLSTANTSTGVFGYPHRNLPKAVIGGKYLTSSTSALRAAVNIYYSNESVKAQVDNDLAIYPDQFLYDEGIYSDFGVLIAGGLEQRRGSSRVQGVYGAELYLAFTDHSAGKFSYANDITLTNQGPTSTFWGNPTSLPAPSHGYRISSYSLGNRLEVGARAFVGAEYFIAPKLSIGGEFFWGFGYRFTSRESVSYESYDPVNDKVVEYTLLGEGYRRFNLGIDNIGGLVNLNLYF